MLSATPVNNRMADLRNQIAFATEGDDTALMDHGIGSIDSTTRLAQKQFNRWLELYDGERTSTRLIEMLGFDYFTLLDLLTIARSRKHIEKYYGTAETGRFPERLRPHQHQGRRRPLGRVSARSGRSTRRSAGSSSPHTRPQLRPATQAGGVRQEVQHRDSRWRGLLPSGRPRSEPDPPDAGQRAEADGKRGAILRPHCAAPTCGRWKRRSPASRAKPRSWRRSRLRTLTFDDPAFERASAARLKCCSKDVDLVRWKQDLIENLKPAASLHAEAGPD